MAKQTLLVENALYEIERERGWQVDGDAYGFAHSLAYVCPKCHKIWAILAFAEEDTHIQGAYCAQHGDGRLLLHYGSIDEPLLENLPEELLKRELLLTLDRLEK